MSVDQADVIDIAGRDKTTGQIVLTISDHLDWEHEQQHLLILEEKLNTYLRYIESGEIQEQYPDAKKGGVQIRIAGVHPLSKGASDYFDQAKKIVEDAGHSLIFEQSEVSE